MASEETGLNLFDDTASAVGNFPSAIRGYDRTAVDDYVRTLEATVVNTRRQARDLEDQIAALSDQLSEASTRPAADNVDYTNLGGRATDILRLAEEQAREMVDRAGVDADRIREVARREADGIRQAAAREGSTIKNTGKSEIEQLRARGRDEAKAQVDKASAEAANIVAAARREADAHRRQAEQEAQTVRQKAYLDTEAQRRQVEREVAETRQQIASEREAAINQLKSTHEEHVAKTAALLAEATEHNKEATARLQKDIAEAERIRSAALAEAERIRVEAVTNAEERIAAAKKQAAAINERTQQEFSWRKQQLKRETDLLSQRKQAVLNQLASLSALAEQTAQTFPDLEELEGFEAEHGDTTLLRPPNLPPSLPSGEGDSTGDSADDTVIEGSVAGDSDSDGPGQNRREESDTETTMVQPAVRDDASSSTPASAASAPAASATSPVASATSPSRPEEESTLVRESGQSGQQNGSAGGPGQQQGQGQAQQQGQHQGGDHTVLAPPPARPAGTDHLPKQPYPGTSAYPEQTGGSGQAPQPYRG